MEKLRRYKVTWWIYDGGKNKFKMSAEVDGQNKAEAIGYIKCLWKIGRFDHQPHGISAKWIDRPE